MLRYNGAYSLDDHYLVNWVQQIVDLHQIQLIIETGTNAGLSTAKFSKMVPMVISVDIDDECIHEAEKNIAIEGNPERVMLVHGDSVVELKLQENAIDSRTLVFLDAHMTPIDTWPVFDEINAIPRSKGILMFHDIKVPDRDFFYSQFVHPDGRVRDFDYWSIRHELMMWSPTHRVQYNTEAAGSRVGVMVVWP